MTPTGRIVASLVATVALVAPTTLSVSAAVAKPAGKPPKTAHTSPVKSQAKQLLKDIAVRDAQLVHLLASGTVTVLADHTELVLADNIGDARTALTDLRADVEAADSTVDTMAARKELLSFRVTNFRHAAVVLKHVEAMATAAATDAEALAFLAEAETDALALTATSTKDEVHAVKALVAAAAAELGAGTTP